MYTYPKNKTVCVGLATDLDTQTILIYAFTYICMSAHTNQINT